MAYTSGTATDYKDLLSKLATFAAANGWTVKEQTSDKLCLMGTGLSGLDEIYCNVATHEDAINSRYNWEMVGAYAYRSGRAVNKMPRSSGVENCYSYFWNAPMQYWMVANGRRIMGFAKVSTTYIPFHLGLLTPPATDQQYPYPLLIGGCGSTKAQNYSATGTACSAYWAGTTTTTANAVGRLHIPGGIWMPVMYESGTAYAVTAVSANYSRRANILTALDNSYILEEIMLADAKVNSQIRTNIYGTVEGLYRVSGYGNSAENIIAVSGINYIVFPDVYRSGVGDYCAMRMN